MIAKIHIYKRVLFLLILLNLVSALVGFYIGCNSPFPDETSYLAMAEGLSQGKFSTWHFLGHFYPETLRMPGYPIFIFIVLSIFGSTFAIKLIQLFLYAIALFLSYKLVMRLSNNSKQSKLTFLFLTALNIQLPFYAGCISSETLCIFMLVICLYIFLKFEHSVGKFASLGLAFGVLYYVRPAFLLLPFFTCAIAFYSYKRMILKRHILTTLLTFIISALPFVVWNYLNHGVMKITPIEGGAGVAHMGYWSFKLPANYIENFYWGIAVFPDITNPIRYTPDEYEINKLSYESEWKLILQSLDHLQTLEDRKYIEIMKVENEIKPGRFLLYNSAYTQQRESELWKGLIRDVSNDPYFYFKSRIYTFFRLFFIGLNPDSLDKAYTLEAKMKVLYPFLITLTTIFFSFLFCTYYLIKFRKKVETDIFFIYYLIVFQAAIHVPFAIQSRFMVPVHLLIFIMISILLSRLEIFSRIGSIIFLQKHNNSTLKFVKF